VGQNPGPRWGPNDLVSFRSSTDIVGFGVPNGVVLALDHFIHRGQLQAFQMPAPGFIRDLLFDQRGFGLGGQQIARGFAKLDDALHQFDRAAHARNVRALGGQDLLIGLDVVARIRPSAGIRRMRANGRQLLAFQHVRRQMLGDNGQRAAVIGNAVPVLLFGVGYRQRL
jgi:hypothetical protein